MDHRAFLAALPQAERERLTARSDRVGLLHLLAHAGGIVALGALIVARVPFWPLLMLPQGILIVFLFTLMHEAAHRTPFRTAWINDAVARVCGVLLVLGADWFRYFHFAHHRHTQDPENDPELASPKPATWRGYLLHLSGIPIWTGQITALVRNAAGTASHSYVPAGARGAGVRREARWLIAAYAAVALVSILAQSTLPLRVWVVPALLGQPFLRFYLLAEHGLCPFVANMFENTRSTATLWVVRKLAWNMPYHAEHHAYPGVPFHRLTELHALVADHLRQTEAGYVRFHAGYVEQLR